MNLVEACRSVRKDLARKQFSPLWSSCEARASLFMSQKRLRKQDFTTLEAL